MWVRNDHGCNQIKIHSRMSIMWGSNVYDVLHRHPRCYMDEQGIIARRGGRLKSNLYHEIEEYVPKFKAGPNNGRNPKRLETNFRLDPMAFKWTIYSNGEIATYGYCHSQKQAEDIVTRELKVRSK